MDHAWLDSLSEDWVSQPRSGSPAPSLPSLSNSTSDSSHIRPALNRIPKYNAQKQSWINGQDGGNSPLSERGFSEKNIPLSQRAQRRPSKLKDVANGRGRQPSRSFSASTTHSIQCHTIQHKSTSLSPSKGLQETPEWKRRLIHGDVAYGEQRDLFSAAGLETIFQPPQDQTIAGSRLPTRGLEEGSSMMPSSPPPYPSASHRNGNHQLHIDESEGGNRNRPQARGMKYRLAESAGSDFSVDDASQYSSFQPALSSHHQDQPSQLSDSISDPQSSVLRQMPEDGGGRTVSGQSDIRNEELSPIYIARHNTIHGEIDYAALGIPPEELDRRLESIGEENSFQSGENRDRTLESLPVDVTAATEDYAHNGRFVNFRRGGHSQEGSFQKRLLSPSSLPAIDESAMLPEESMQASTPKQLPHIKKTRASNEYQDHHPDVVSPAPNTPTQRPSKSPEKEHKSSSGSPLKLFGTYDTFTNQKLLRRLSQFEGDYDERDESEEEPGLERNSLESHDNEEAPQPSSSGKVVQKGHSHQHISRKLNSFGAGELDNFQFSEEISYDSSRSGGHNEDRDHGTVPVLSSKGQGIFKFQLEPSPALEEDDVVHHKTRYSTTSKTTTKHAIRTHEANVIKSSDSEDSPGLPPSQRQEDLQTPRKRNGNSEGKRLPKTPLKDPTPKRRRTLQMSEVTEREGDGGEDSHEFDSLKETHQQMQSVIGRKRKDARHGDDQQAANPNVLAMRQILRPRTPTPSQRSSQLQERTPLQGPDLTSTAKARLLQAQKIAKIQAELDSTEPLKLSTALGMSLQMQDDSRKGSVTTQDFLDEAKKIMAGIRGKARPRSGLTSLEESESENDRNQSTETKEPDGEVEDSYQESTQEPFSRPPSREGKPLSRLPPKQEDPALLDHLRKYQEKNDMEGVIASSMRSIAMAREAADSAKEIDRITDETISRASTRLWHGDHHSDPPNIRISENPDLHRKRKHSASSIPLGGDDDEVDFPSQGSNASSGHSTSRSIPTGSSRGSDSRRVIVPQSVSHLIPEQVAGMVFDRAKNIWVKRKAVSGESKGSNFLPSDETEDDPFGDIPDLSVDETQELQRIKAVAAKRKEEERIANQPYPNDPRYFDTTTQDRSASAHKSRQNSGINGVASAEASKAERNPSKSTLSSPKVDNEQPLSKLPRNEQKSQQQRSTVYTETEEEIFEEVEREISIHEDRVGPVSPVRRRNVTISFSSPLASVIQSPGYDYGVEVEREADEASPCDNECHDDTLNDSIIVAKQGSAKRSVSSKKKTSFRVASRRLSLGGHKFSTRPVSRIDERDEDLHHEESEDQHRRSISIVVTTPIPSRKASNIVLATPRPAHEVGTLSLTPLSDFTVHHANESLGLDVSYVAQNQRFVVGVDTKRTLSLSIKELVEKLTEVEPYEPFWEHIKEVSLKSKNLTTLHKLDGFCEQLEELDVSQNRISQLDGAPTSLRHLRITRNCLTDLTAWGHLSNLQYVDVSNNDLTSLSGFKYLVHLRGLKADNNSISSLDGIGQMDGLLSLRLRNNHVRTLDFSSTKLQRITDLDLKGNKINQIHNVQELRSLSILNLEENEFSGKFSGSGSETLWSLKYLKLSGNNISSIDVSQYPNLRLLYLDRNCLGKVTGLLKTKHLDSLSLREQKDGAVLDSTFLSEGFEIRKLFLSGNYLGTFRPQVEFLNLQYLELANCGLEELPGNFGRMMSNTRVLNLNFNALKDIRPLAGIIRLKKLHLAGNRLTRLRSTTIVLSQFLGLSLLDMRGNPLTLGFYPPINETRIVVGQEVDGDETMLEDPFTIAKADRVRDQKYAGCLDMETKMLRRLFEIMVSSSCPRLKTLDGLNVEKKIFQHRDAVWDSLVHAGILSRSPDNEPLEGQENHLTENVNERPEDEERWQGEDSFA